MYKVVKPFMCCYGRAQVRHERLPAITLNLEPVRENQPGPIEAAWNAQVQDPL